MASEYLVQKSSVELLRTATPIPGRPQNSGPHGLGAASEAAPGQKPKRPESDAGAVHGGA